MDVSAIIIFHNEDMLAHFSVQSLLVGVEAARARGIVVETCAVLDRPTALTKQVLDAYRSQLDNLLVADFGDLGSSRNYGREKTTGKYVTFFDGDDLWGEDWIGDAFFQAEGENDPRSIYHPELIHYFSADDYLAQATGEVPSGDVRGYFFVQVDSASSAFDPRTIFFNNLWTANSFARRSVYDAMPYLKVDRAMGFGVEDWTWNAHTLAAGYSHVIVRDTVHSIRVRRTGSLSQQNVKEKLLPPLHNLAEIIDGL